MIKIEPGFHSAGCRQQIARARRFFETYREQSERVPIVTDQLQDMLWAFFQNCWHIKDWLEHDPLVAHDVKVAAIYMAHESTILQTCQGLCNGTKHLISEDYRGRKLANTGHLGYTTYAMPAGAPDKPNEVDFNVRLIERADGTVATIPAKELARQCLVEWERIFKVNGLPFD